MEKGNMMCARTSVGGNERSRPRASVIAGASSTEQKGQIGCQPQNANFWGWLNAHSTDRQANVDRPWHWLAQARTLRETVMRVRKSNRPPEQADGEPLLRQFLV